MLRLISSEFVFCTVVLLKNIPYNVNTELSFECRTMSDFSKCLPGSVSYDELLAVC